MMPRRVFGTHNLDAALGQQFLEVAIREAISQVPTHRQDDRVRQEPKAPKRRTRNFRHRTTPDDTGRHRTTPDDTGRHRRGIIPRP
jgi:hypothetical protein